MEKGRVVEMHSEVAKEVGEVLEWLDRMEQRICEEGSEVT